MDKSTIKSHTISAILSKRTIVWPHGIVQQVVAQTHFIISLCKFFHILQITNRIPLFFGKVIRISAAMLSINFSYSAICGILTNCCSFFSRTALSGNCSWYCDTNIGDIVLLLAYSTTSSFIANCLSSCLLE